MKKLVHIIIKLLFLIMLMFILLTLFKPDLIKQAIAWVWVVIENLGYWNYPILTFISSIESFPLLWVIVPGQQLTLVIWGFLWINSLYLSIFFVTLWAMIWNWIWYILWKYYWKTFFKDYWDWIWVWETELKYLESWIKNNWAKFIILWKFHWLTRSFIPFIAWSLWMQSKKFWLYNFIGSVIWAVTILSLWIIFVKTYEWIVDNSWKISLLIMLLVWLYIYFFKRESFKKYIQEKNKEIEKKVREAEAKKNR